MISADRTVVLQDFERGGNGDNVEVCSVCGDEIFFKFYPWTIYTLVHFHALFSNKIYIFSTAYLIQAYSTELRNMDAA